MPGLDKHKLEDLEELGEGLAIHLTESELNEKPISVLELTMTDSEVSKHPMENKLAVMEEYRNSATKNYFHHTSTLDSNNERILGNARRS